MKKIVGMMVCCLLFLFCVAVLADGAGAASSDAIIESAHPYNNNEDESWTYRHPTSAEYLKVTFSEDTETEEGYDFIYMTDSQGDTESFSGKALSNQEVYVPGSSFTIRLTSDNTKALYGFKITSIVAVSKSEYDSRLIDSGSCGENATYRLFANGLFTVEGSGPMTGYNSAAYWNGYKSVITSVVIGGQITSVGVFNFANCPNLTKVTLSDSVTSIGRYAFRDCSALEEVVMGKGVIEIEERAFAGCDHLVSISLGENVISIGCYAFGSCTGLTDIYIPKSVKRIEEGAFYNCTKLKMVTFGYNVTSIELKVFENCKSLESIVLGQEISAIGDRAFFGCERLKSISVPDSVLTIGKAAFFECSSLRDVSIGSGVTQVGECAFAACSNLTTFNVSSSNSSFTSDQGVLFNKR